MKRSERWLLYQLIKNFMRSLDPAMASRSVAAALQSTKDGAVVR